MTWTVTDNDTKSGVVLTKSIAPVASEMKVEVAPSSSTESIIVSPPTAKKKKKSKVT